MKPNFKQIDIFRLLKGAQKAGKHIERIEIDTNGKIVAVFKSSKRHLAENPWDTVLK